ncbi:MAG: DUF3189 family protein [Dethiobacter sp.]|jgi:hypothetical protein|nr:DUF3189 family protein [Dethiobacter sp.]MBS3902315.1 DUF3189 family protein [Dethiobacter sp.]MBS3989394.1 DUF3189 family protein [Dethiobacter sp.]
MIYLYLGQNDLCLPVTAASLQLGLLMSTSLPAYEDLAKLPHFRTVGKEDEGMLCFMGEDRQGNKVYVTSVKGHPDVFIRGVGSLLSVCQIPLQEVVVVPCIAENPQVSRLCRIITLLGFKESATRLGSRVARNRFRELAATTYAK